MHHYYNHHESLLITIQHYESFSLHLTFWQLWKITIDHLKTNEINEAPRRRRRRCRRRSRRRRVPATWWFLLIEVEEKGGKTMGKLWENQGFLGCCGFDHDFAIGNMARELDFW